MSAAKEHPCQYKSNCTQAGLATQLVDIGVRATEKLHCSRLSLAPSSGALVDAVRSCSVTSTPVGIGGCGHPSTGHRPVSKCAGRSACADVTKEEIAHVASDTVVGSQRLFRQRGSVMLSRQRLPHPRPFLQSRLATEEHCLGLLPLAWEHILNIQSARLPFCPSEFAWMPNPLT